MKRHSLTLNLAFTSLSASLVALAGAQTPAAPPEPAVEIRAAAPLTPQKEQIRSAAIPSTKSKTSPLGTKEQNIVKNLPSMNVEQLREMAEVYTRVGNQRMAELLIGELTRRDPKSADVATLQADLLPDQGGQDDPEADRAQELYAAGKPREAAAVLQRLKAEKYRGKTFRYQQDLAYALMESGQEAAAQAAFQELLRNRSTTAEEKADARKTLASMALEALQAKGHAALTARDARRALEVANQLLAKNPQDADGMALKVSAMSITGHNAEAIQMLETLRAAAGSNVFVHQKTLADAYYDARQLDAAEAAYQVVLANKSYPAEDRVEARTRLADLHRDRLITQGERFLQSGKTSKAETILVQLELERPVHPDTKAFKAAILNKQHRYAEAKELLESMLKDARQPFEANVELADSYANTGNWSGAGAQYAVAENDAKNPPTERFEAARMAREMVGRYRPTVASNYEVESGAEGNVWRAASEASTGDLGGGNMFLVRANWDQVYLQGTRAIARREADRFQAELAYRRLIANGFFGEASIGGSDNDVVYGAKVGRYEGPGMAWELSYRGNDRATDSLELEAINGRQNVVSLYLGTHFSKRFYLDSHIFFRQVTVGGQTLGHGWGLDMNVGYTFLEETARRPELAISYFNEISSFSGRSMGANFTERYGRKGIGGRLEDSLIDRAINRHGVIITISKQINHRVSAYVYGGVSYEFENHELEGRAGAGLEAYLAPNTTLNVGLDYTTSGNNGNRGSNVLTGTVGVKYSF